MLFQEKQSLADKINPLSQCRKYGVGLWQCPPFLFLIMGAIIIVVIVITYFVATLKIEDPTTVSLIVLAVAAVLIIIDYIITSSFERITEASRMKTEFINVVSHQLRSPLTNLKFSLETLMSLKGTNFSKREIEYLTILKDNTKRMNTLINQLLLVSRIETERLPLNKSEFSIVEMTRNLVLKTKPFAEASNVKIILKAPNSLPDVYADPMWTEQIIQNLLDNAIRYIEQKGEVRIRIYPEEKYVQFEIQDTGVGIPKEEQKFIFQKFFRSRNALRHQTEGSGLGLYIAKQIIEVMGGKIWFESEEGKGTTFYFKLPVKKEKS
jgi:signal transduction histidine kinase